MEVIINSIYIWIFLVGILVLGCVVSHLCKKGYYAALTHRGYKMSAVFDFIGTPVHEAGHAMMCVVFGFKIKKVVWYKPDKTNGTLGYVSFSYTKYRLVNAIGGFFTSIGPLFSGSIVIALLMWLMTPDLFATFMTGVASDNTYTAVSIANVATFYGSILWSNFVCLFAASNLINVWWYLFIFLALSIARHMALSGMDIRNGLNGLLILSLILLAVSLVLGIISISFQTTVALYALWLSGIIMSFVCMAIIMNLILLVGAWIVKGILYALPTKH